MARKHAHVQYDHLERNPGKPLPSVNTCCPSHRGTPTPTPIVLTPPSVRDTPLRYLSPQVHLNERTTNAALHYLRGAATLYSAQSVRQ